jgi:hypothetical protein
MLDGNTLRLRVGCEKSRSQKDEEYQNTINIRNVLRRMQKHQSCEIRVSKRCMIKCNNLFNSEIKQTKYYTRNSKTTSMRSTEHKGSCRVGEILKFRISSEHSWEEKQRIQCGKREIACKEINRTTRQL